MQSAFNNSIQLEKLAQTVKQNSISPIYLCYDSSEFLTKTSNQKIYYLFSTSPRITVKFCSGKPLTRMYTMKKIALFSFLAASLASFSGMAADYTIYPTSITKSNGTVSTVAISALKVQDQSGTQNDWSKYLEFTPGTTFKGVFNFTLPTTINPADIVAYKLNVNYLGQAKASQTWNFHLRNFATASYTLLGNNSAATSWVWSPFSFSLAAGANYVSSGVIKLQYSSNNNVDVSDLDYVALVITTKTISPTPTPTPTPTPSPTPTPTPTPIGSWYKPVVGTKFAIQFSGLPLVNVAEAQAQDVDLFDTAQSTIDSLHANGKKVICYYSGGSFEDWRSDANTFPSAVLGNNLSGWPGEKWLNVSRIDLLQPIMAKRTELAKSKKCDAVEVDNVDGYTNNTGFALTYAHQLAYNKMLANEAHIRGLGIGLKNDLLQVVDLADTFDFSINEQCFYYNECNYLTPFITKGKPVFNIEYDVAASTFCPKANKLQFSSVKKHLNLDGWVDSCSNYPTAP